MLAVAAVLLMDTANTYLMFNYIPGFTGEVPATEPPLRAQRAAGLQTGGRG